jgi:hypothetical protein
MQSNVHLAWAPTDGKIACIDMDFKQFGEVKNFNIGMNESLFFKSSNAF